MLLIESENVDPDMEIAALLDILLALRETPVSKRVSNLIISVNTGS